MKAALFAALVVASSMSCACGSDDSNGKTTSTGGSASAGTTSSGGDKASAGGDATAATDACHDGCVATLAAKCSNGPTDRSGCETTCHALEAGKCGAEYATLQQCAEGKDITCSAQGQPTIAACPDQQAAFVACLN